MEDNENEIVSQDEHLETIPVDLKAIHHSTEEKNRRIAEILAITKIDFGLD